MSSAFTKGKCARGRPARPPAPRQRLRKVLNRRGAEPPAPTDAIEPRAAGTSQKSLAEMQTQNNPMGSDTWQKVGPDCPK